MSAVEITEMEPRGSILPSTSPHASAESSVRMALVQLEAVLEETRQVRDDANDQIRILVEQRATLRSAAGTFSRRAKVEAAAAHRARPSRSETTS